MPTSSRARLYTLADASWMQELSPSMQARIVSECYQTHHERGELVARKGDIAHSWIGVASGLLVVTAGLRNGKGVMFGGIPPGSWVGEGSVLKHETRHYDAVAIVQTTLLHVPAESFACLMDTSIAFNRFIVRQLNERLGQFMGMVLTDRLSDPVVRVSRAISGLYNPVLYKHMSLLLPLSQEELGELAGLTRQRTNRAIKTLEGLGYVVPEYGGLRIRNLRGLRELGDRLE